VCDVGQRQENPRGRRESSLKYPIFGPQSTCLLDCLVHEPDDWMFHMKEYVEQYIEGTLWKVNGERLIGAYFKVISR
jgi:hypothetical protein